MFPFIKVALYYWYMQNMLAINDLRQLVSVCVCVCVVITGTAICSNGVHFCPTPIVVAYCSVCETIPEFNEFVQDCFSG